MALLDPEALVLLAILTVTPGADTFLTLRQALAGGLRAAVPTIAGICLGLLIHATLAGIGLAIILREAPAFFVVVQFAGVAYLGYLGFRSLVLAVRMPDIPAPPVVRHAFRDGLLTNLLNPKVALFYLGFLPQFIPPTQPFWLTSILYGLVHALMGQVQLGVVAVTAHALGRRVITSRKFRQGTELVAGIALLAFAIRLAVSN